MFAVSFVKEVLSFLTCQKKKTEKIEKTEIKKDKGPSKPKKTKPAVSILDYETLKTIQEEFENEYKNKIIEQKRLIKSMNRQLKSNSKNRMEAMLTNKPLASSKATSTDIEQIESNLEVLNDKKSWSKLNVDSKMTLQDEMEKYRDYLRDLDLNSLITTEEQQSNIGGIWP